MKRLALLPLAATIYFCVSGGPHGLEPLMQSGAGLGILLILIVPIIWALPAALMTAELASAIPSEGGYYVWVKRALGPFWAACAGWCTWIYSWVDVAIYPGLFAFYTARLLGAMGYGLALDENPMLKWGIGLIIIIPLTYLNLRGANSVGQAAKLFGIVLFLPFAVMVCLGLPQLMNNPSVLTTPFIAQDQTLTGALSTGLFVVMWNYLGWDSLSTIAGEVENPKRNFPRAIFIALPIVILSYLLPVAVGLAYGPSLPEWTEGFWPELGRRIGGRPLEIWIAITGMVGTGGLFAATLLAGSRIPFVLAEDRLLPKFLTEKHPKFGTPVMAILVSAAFYTFFSYSSFEWLAVCDVILYSAALMLEFVALAVLRVKEPNLPRPFRIPGGWPAIALVILSPAAIIAFAIWSQIKEEGMTAIYLSLIGIAIGPIAYLIAKTVNFKKASAEPRAPE